MHIVYLLRSKKNPKILSIGLCNDIKERLAHYNSGGSKFMVEHRPWEVDIAIYFQEEAKASAFEQYLKGSSGRYFMKRHF
jgi:predicted GIY-YIG superfamily endonuclease